MNALCAKLYYIRPIIVRFVVSVDCIVKIAASKSTTTVGTKGVLGIRQLKAQTLVHIIAQLFFHFCAIDDPIGREHCCDIKFLIFCIHGLPVIELIYESL